MRTAIGAVALLLLGACVHGSAVSGDPRSTFDLALSGEGSSVTATCSVTGCTGPEIQVVLDAASARGMLGRDAIDLNFTDGTINGSIGSEPVKLTVDDAHLAGTFAGSLGDLRVGADKIEGRVGRCSYDLRSKNGVDYQGQRACGGGPVQAALHLPETLLHLPRTERLAVMALLLAR
jgi:hypothetical protein